MDCTYCIVPATRGRERSRTLPDVLQEVANLAAQGYREIMFLGQTVNAYGEDLRDGASTFVELIRRTDRIFPRGRVRFLSAHPKKMSDDLIDAWPDIPSLCDHIHLPVQSGSDHVLRRMKRLYSSADFLRTVERLRRRMPGIAITTDFIVGFPGETEEDFQETLNLCESIRFDSAYMYLYSRRGGTAATRLAGEITRAESLDRHNRLVELQMRHTDGSLARQVGQTVQVLFEMRAREGGLFGKSGRFHDVIIDLPDAFIGSVVPVRIERVVRRTLRGTPLLSSDQAPSGAVNTSAPLPAGA